MAKIKNRSKVYLEEKGGNEPHIKKGGEVIAFEFEV